MDAEKKTKIGKIVAVVLGLIIAVAGAYFGFDASEQAQNAEDIIEPVTGLIENLSE